jgi:spore coat polysaccharide biosynthesis protein SpsF
MTTAAIVQARMGSTRLPGKVMLPLDCLPVIDHVLSRTAAAETVDGVILATSTSDQDDILADRATRRDVPVYRGDERDVLGRIHAAASAIGADIVVRVCADSPLLSPGAIDVAVDGLRDAGADYVSTITTEGRNVPVGLDVEVCTMESLTSVTEQATERHEREHVTVYYRDHPDRYHVVTLAGSEVFDSDRLLDRPDLRLTLDEAADYRLLERIYDAIGTDDSIVDLASAVEYVDEHELTDVNASVRQKSPYESEE